MKLTESFRKIIREEIINYIISENKVNIYTYLYKSPRLKSTIIDLFSEQYIFFLNDIMLSAPKPTIFTVVLKNDYRFQLIYADKVFIAKVDGKRYRLDNVSDMQRCREKLSQLLTLASPTLLKNEMIDPDFETTEGGEGGLTTSDSSGNDVPATSSTSVFQPIEDEEN